MIAFLLLTQAAFAGSVYINGVRVDVLPEVTVTNATVRLDSQGNVWIDAPGYRVQVLQTGQAVNVPPAGSSQAAPQRTQAASQPDPASGAARIGTGVWWLVTEDNTSSGHALEIIVNGALVRRIVSGDPQLLFDIGPYLRHGSNAVVINALPGPTPGGGALSVYIGRGNNLSGTIRLDSPDVTYSRRASDGGSGGRQYTLTIP